MLFHSKTRRILAVLAAALCFIMASGSVSASTERKFNMSYIYFGNASTYTYYVDRTKNSLDEISPNYFNIDDNGNLLITSAANVDFINQMHDRGIKVVPFLSNHWDRDKGRKAIANAQTFAEQVIAAVHEYNVDGINIDIENLNEDDRDSYMELLKIFRDLLPVDKTLAIAAAPNPWGLTKGWQGSYDYAKMAEYCDYIMLMTYDEHYQGSEPGPVACLSFVEKSIKSALQVIPKDKLVLGIPFYGRFWNNSKSYGGYGISAKEVEQFVRDYNRSVTFDTVTGSPKAVITFKAGNVPKVFGKDLEPGTYTFWYENDRSIKLKLQLVQKYDLKGTGSWSLGQESESTWDYYELWLNGQYFSDISGHWAQDDILSMQRKGWMVGYTGSTFAPDAGLTRAQAAAILVRALGYDDWTGITVFNDTKGHWAEKEIGIAAQHGIVSGVGNGNFNPDSVVTREQIAAMIDRSVALQPTGSSTKTFTDVNPDSWSYQNIMNLSAYGLLQGYDDGGFHPNATLTRAQMAAIMNRASTADQVVLAGKDQGST